jgi:hypothetical protein
MPPDLRADAAKRGQGNGFKGGQEQDERQVDGRSEGMRRTVPRRHLVLLAYPAHGQQQRVREPRPGDRRGTVNRDRKGDDPRCGEQAQPDVLLEARRQTASHILLFGKVAHVLKTNQPTRATGGATWSRLEGRTLPVAVRWGIRGITIACPYSLTSWGQRQ